MFLFKPESVLCIYCNFKLLKNINDLVILNPLHVFFNEYGHIQNYANHEEILFDRCINMCEQRAARGSARN